MKKSNYSTKVYSSKKLAFGLNLFPPLFFNKIKIESVNENFTKLKVVVRYSWMNRNIQKAIFGGTIFSAFDPYYAVMYWQIFSQLKAPMQVWVKKAEINYLKPAKSDLTIDFTLNDIDIRNAIEQLKVDYKYEVTHTAKAIDEEGEVCAEAKILIYILTFGWQRQHLHKKYHRCICHG